jgi:hypothetical protein
MHVEVCKPPLKVFFIYRRLSTQVEESIIVSKPSVVDYLCLFLLMSVVLKKRLLTRLGLVKH